MQFVLIEFGKGADHPFSLANSLIKRVCIKPDLRRSKSYAIAVDKNAMKTTCGLV